MFDLCYILGFQISTKHDFRTEKLVRKRHLHLFSISFWLCLEFQLYLNNESVLFLHSFPTILNKSTGMQMILHNSNQRIFRIKKEFYFFCLLYSNFRLNQCCSIFPFVGFFFFYHHFRILSAENQQKKPNSPNQPDTFEHMDVG